MSTIHDVGWVRKQPEFNYWDTARLSDQESLIRQIAKASEVWLTALTPAGRASVKLSPAQLATFAAMVAKYDSLRPQ